MEKHFSRFFLYVRAGQCESFLLAARKLRPDCAISGGVGTNFPFVGDSERVLIFETDSLYEGMGILIGFELSQKEGEPPAESVTLDWRMGTLERLR